MAKPILYLAYASNLNRRQMRGHCPTAIPVANTEIPGYTLLFRGRNGGATATIEPGDDSVPSTLWHITAKDEKALDYHEGYPDFYRKKTVTVKIDGETVDAMVYVMTDGHPLGMLSQHYLAAVKEGYRASGFGERTLTQALERSVPEHISGIDINGQLCFMW